MSVWARARPSWPQRAEAQDIDVVDLRHLAAELSPDHPAGERLVVDLVKEGRQPRQAVGYLPEGDMVVVNDASHLVGHASIEVVVSSARQTSQGLLVFAQLSRAVRRWPSSGPTRAESPLPSRRGQAVLTAATSFDNESLASPKSMVVFGS